MGGPGSGPRPGQGKGKMRKGSKYSFTHPLTGERWQGKQGSKTFTVLKSNRMTKYGKSIAKQAKGTRFGGK